MYCTNCGNEIENEIKFCPKCGTRVQKVVTNKIPVQNIQEYSETNAYGKTMREEVKIQQYYEAGSNKNDVGMSAKTTSVVAYMTWIGFIVSLCAGDKDGAKFYMNQAFVYHLFTFLCWIPFLGMFWAIFMLICFILGVIWAAEQEERELPLIGKIHILN